MKSFLCRTGTGTLKHDKKICKCCGSEFKIILIQIRLCLTLFSWNLETQKIEFFSGKFCNLKVNLYYNFLTFR